MKKIFSAIKGFISGAVLGCVIFCALGLAAHVFVGFWTPAIPTERCDDYSLRNRFECAFSFNTPERHKYYYDSYPDGPSGTPAGEQRYLAHPLFTYPLILLCGIVGALAGIGEAEKKKNNANKNIEET